MGLGMGLEMGLEMGMGMGLGTGLGGVQFPSSPDNPFPADDCLSGVAP